MKRVWSVLLLLVAVGCRTGRPDQGFVQSCHDVVRGAGVGSARAQRNVRFPWLRSDTGSIRRLSQALDRGQLEALKAETKTFLTQGQELGWQLMDTEMLRLPDGSVDRLYQLHAPGSPSPAASAVSARRRQL